MTTSPRIRAVAETELAAFAHVGQHAFNSNWPADEQLALDRQVFEPERSLAALDGDQIVGTALAYSFGLTVPGGSVPAAGISAVAVLPTHRRRGILSALMRRQLADIAAGTEPVAALFASEAAIYGRFGYGSAAEQYSFSIRRGEGQLRPLPAAAGNLAGSSTVPEASTSAGRSAPVTLRLADPQDAVADLKMVYEAIRPNRPGMLTRTDSWWKVLLADPEFLRNGTGPVRCVIAADTSGPRGYALYAARPDWGSDGMPAQVLIVRDLIASDPEAAAALWSDLLSRDLVAEIWTRMRPADDPLLRLLTDPRRARTRVSDGLWIRLVDVQAALTRRRYACAVDVVIDVSDDLLPHNAGRWRLTAGGPADQAAPTCERTGAGADISLPVSALGAAYLGGTRLGTLASVGQVREHRPGALLALSAAMWWDPAPWCPNMF